MSGINSVPDLLRAVEDLTRRVYELQRRRGPRTGIGGGDATDPIIFRTDGNPEAFLELTTSDIGSHRAELVLGWGDPATEPGMETATEFRADVYGTLIYMYLPTHPNDQTLMKLRTPDGAGAHYEAGLWVWTTNDAATRHASVDCNGLTDSTFGGATLQAWVSDDAAGEGFWEANFEWDGTWDLTLDYQFTGDPDVRWWFLGVEGMDPSVVFGIFDQGDTPAAQAAAVDVSAETTAIQDIYAALRAYGWFAA